MAKTAKKKAAKDPAALPKTVYGFWDAPNDPEDRAFLVGLSPGDVEDGKVGIYVLQEVVEVRRAAQIRRGRGQWEVVDE